MKNINFRIEKSINLILSPHLDDAVISMGGFLYKNFKNTKVITIFSGKPKFIKHTIWDLACGFNNSDKAIESRILENKTALTYLGVLPENIINLEYLDRQYLTRENVKQDFSKLINLIDKVILDNKDKKINIFSPLTTIHTDHKSINNFIFLEKDSLYKKHNNIKFFLYEDYPYFLKYKIPKTLLGNDFFLLLSDEELEIKRKAIYLYRSQFRFPISKLRYFRKKIIENKGRKFNKENFYLID